MGSLNNGVKLTWLGHATWLLETPGGKRVLFDPWTDGNPMCPDAYKGAGCGHIDLILVTHGHGDHMGDLVGIVKQTGAQVVAIAEIAIWLGTKGVTNCTGMNKGGTIAVKGLKVTMTNAVHSSGFLEDGRLIDLGDPAGFVVELENGYKIYNAGDTAVFGDMALIAELYEPDLAMLPVGDHYTMGPKEAAKAVELLRVKKVVPQHYGTFPVLTGTPRMCRELMADDVEILEIAPGDTIT
jgi:L-ascorbate metabolism protein UlaG (beta-lactamase superfamily)